MTGPLRTVTDAERRARLGLRHALAAPAVSPSAAAAAVVCLHATESASVYLSAWARSGASRQNVEDALYTDRSLVKQLAMRRTVLRFPATRFALSGVAPGRASLANRLHFSLAASPPAASPKMATLGYVACAVRLTPSCVRDQQRQPNREPWCLPSQRARLHRSAPPVRPRSRWRPGS